MIQVLDKSFEEFITRDEIEREVISLGKALSSSYSGKEVVFLAVLNGAFMFASDLMKAVDLDCEISFVKMSSYQGTTTTGKVEELIGLYADIRNKHVVILEDIVDTGHTIDKIISLLDGKDAASISVCTLLYKPDAFQGVKKPDFVGFSIPNAFVVGYGLDYDEKGRNLDAIYQIRDANK